ncbi:hypothetical protein BpHYR1_006357 [Brachionus plicatilis]|uniref:Uncharacterized protein n=1 Tax=Brachionus plicatilis TaxID=10195 RepID=A0A3M7S9P5_BRAPC|nr:hypothetical protein BpHYR1_006357 [Brachionus plicatilis]
MFLPRLGAEKLKFSISCLLNTSGRSLDEVPLQRRYALSSLLINLSIKCIDFNFILCKKTLVQLRNKGATKGLVTNYHMTNYFQNLFTKNKNHELKAHKIQIWFKATIELKFKTHLILSQTYPTQIRIFLTIGKKLKAVSKYYQFVFTECKNMIKSMRKI